MNTRTMTLGNGQTAKLGRIRPTTIVSTDKYVLREYADGSHKLTLRMGHYYNAAKDQVQPVPATNWRAKALASIKRMYLNDTEGDCVIAGKYHSVGVWTGNEVGTPAVGTDAEVQSMYMGICGPGDQGCVITTVLDYMKAKGLPFNGVLHKIADYVSVDWTNKLLMQVGIAVFGTVTLGINLPQAWMDAPDGGTWDVTTTPIIGGHDVPCFTGDTKVSLLDGTERTFKELADGAAGERFWVYSCDAEGNVVPGLAHSARMTRRDAELVKVTLDNGETIRCTLDHRFMLRDGTYREAGKLQSGDSLMPLYRKLGTKQMKGYERVYNPATKKWRFTHRVSAAAAHGGRYKGEVVHHADFNKRNNAPDNLEVMSWDAHTRLHSENTESLRRYAQSEEGRTKSREVVARLWADPEWRAKMVKQLGENGRAACNRRSAEGRNGFQTWTEEDHRRVANETDAAARNLHTPEAQAKSGAARSKLYATDPEARQRMVERQTKAAAGASRQQRSGLTDAQRAVRRENIKKAHAARMAKVKPNNHKVVSVEPVGREDVYDMTVDGHHNFALSAGVFVHNCIDYDQNGVWVATWGGTRLITWAAMASKTWVEEADVLLSPDWYSSGGLAPNGIDAATLAADLAKLAGGVIPDPSPTPVPPVPSPYINLGVLTLKSAPPTGDVNIIIGDMNVTTSPPAGAYNVTLTPVGQPLPTPPGPAPIPPTPGPTPTGESIVLAKPVRAGQLVRFTNAHSAGTYVKKTSDPDTEVVVEAE